MDCDCLVGREVDLLGCKIVSDDAAVSALLHRSNRGVGCLRLSSSSSTFSLLVFFLVSRF